MPLGHLGVMGNFPELLRKTFLSTLLGVGKEGPGIELAKEIIRRKGTRYILIFTRPGVHRQDVKLKELVSLGLSTF